MNELSVEWSSYMALEWGSITNDYWTRTWLVVKQAFLYTSYTHSQNSISEETRFVSVALLMTILQLVEKFEVTYSPAARDVEFTKWSYALEILSSFALLSNSKQFFVFQALVHVLHGKTDEKQATVYRNDHAKTAM